MKTEFAKIFEIMTQIQKQLTTISELLDSIEEAVWANNDVEED